MTIRDPGPDDGARFDCRVHGVQVGRFAVLDGRGREHGRPRYRCRLCMRAAGRAYYRRRYGWR